MKKVNIKGAVMKAAAVGAGAVAGAYLNKISFVSNLSAPIRGAAKLALGTIVIPMLGKGKNGELLNNVGNGIAATGAIELANGTIFKSSPVTLSGLPTLGNVVDMKKGYYVDEVSGLPTLGQTADTY